MGCCQCVIPGGTRLEQEIGARRCSHLGELASESRPRCRQISPRVRVRSLHVCWGKTEFTNTAIKTYQAAFQEDILAGPEIRQDGLAGWHSNRRSCRSPDIQLCESCVPICLSISENADEVFNTHASISMVSLKVLCPS